MSDADVDARVKALSDADLELIVRDQWSDLTYLRPRALAVRMAKEILRLRGQVRELTAEVARNEGQE